MRTQNFFVKTGVSAAIPLALVLLLKAAPVSGQTPDASDDTGFEQAHNGTQEVHKAAKAPANTAQIAASAVGTSSVASSASTAAATTAPVQGQNQVEVTADRVRQPLPTPNADLRLPRLYLADMRPWNWDALWHASEWANNDSSIPWKYARVKQGFGGDTHFILNSTGGAELKAQKGHPAWTAAMYEVDVTIPAMRPGLIASPVWLFNDETNESIAVQVVGQRHLQITIHGSPEGIASSEEFRLPGDYSGRRMRVAIRRHAELGLIDIFLDGELVHSFNEESSAFPKSPMRPIISIYPSDKHGWAKNWAGKWEPMQNGDRVRMTVHGFRATPL